MTEPVLRFEHARGTLEGRVMTDQTVRRLIAALVAFCVFMIVIQIWIAIGPD